MKDPDKFNKPEEEEVEEIDKLFDYWPINNEEKE